MVLGWFRYSRSLATYPSGSIPPYCEGYIPFEWGFHRRSNETATEPREWVPRGWESRSVFNVQTRNPSREISEYQIGRMGAKLERTIPSRENPQRD